MYFCLCFCIFVFEYFIQKQINKYTPNGNRTRVERLEISYSTTELLMLGISTTGIEPVTCGATIRRSTTELRQDVLLHKVSIFGPPGYEPGALPLRYEVSVVFLVKIYADAPPSHSHPLTSKQGRGF